MSSTAGGGGGGGGIAGFFTGAAGFFFAADVAGRGFVDEVAGLAGAVADSAPGAANASALAARQATTEIARGRGASMAAIIPAAVPLQETRYLRRAAGSRRNSQVIDAGGITWKPSSSTSLHR
jgi:hypothetical protein